jgi:parallel beta-helix repeat protein
MVTLACLTAVLALPAQPARAAASALPDTSPRTVSETLDTAYAVPPNALFLATTGSDANAGTATAPLRTLRTALIRAQAGQTVVVRGGTYRQGVADPTTSGYPDGTAWLQGVKAGVTVQAYPHERVWFDGTDVVRSWTRGALGWSTPWSTPTFCGARYYSVAIASQSAAGPCTHADMAVKGTATGSPHMVFRNGVAVPEVDTPGELTAGTFYYDQAARVLHLGFDPTGATVEVTKRAQALAVLRPERLSIKGIGFRRFGSNEYPNATNGAVALNGGTDTVVERSVFTENAGGGLLSWQSVRLAVRSSLLVANGFNGMAADGSSSRLSTNPGARDDLLIEGSRLDRNNTDGFGPACTASCAAAGAKLAHMVGLTIRNSSFSNNGSPAGGASGFWCDLRCSEAWIHDNTVVGNTRHGIVYEVSDRGTIASNFVASNGWAARGTGLMMGSANTRVYNNTFVNNRNHVLLYDDNRPTGPSTGPNTSTVDFVNNLVVGGDANRAQVTARAGSSTPSENTTPTEFIRTYDHNAFHRPPGTCKWLLNWLNEANTNGLFTTPAAVYAAHRVAARDVQVTTSADPFFVNAAEGDYRVRPGSPAYRNGKPLPLDLAARLGVSSSTAVDRGVLW